MDRHFVPLELIQLLTDLFLGLVVQVEKGGRGIRPAAVIRIPERGNYLHRLHKPDFPWTCHASLGQLQALTFVRGDCLWGLCCWGGWVLLPLVLQRQDSLHKVLIRFSAFNVRLFKQKKKDSGFEGIPWETKKENLPRKIFGFSSHENRARFLRIDFIATLRSSKSWATWSACEAASVSRPSFRIFLSWSSTADGRCSSRKESFRATVSRSICSSAAKFGFRMGSKVPADRRGGRVRKERG